MRGVGLPRPRVTGYRLHPIGGGTSILALSAALPPFYPTREGRGRLMTPLARFLYRDSR